MKYDFHTNKKKVAYFVGHGVLGNFGWMGITLYSETG